MKRESEVPAELIAYLEKNKTKKKQLNKLNLFCTIPVKAVKMKVLINNDQEKYRTVIIPAVDIYTTIESLIKPGFFDRDKLAYFISGTATVFPYGHVFVSSGYICLGNLFVPSAVSEKAPQTPLETLFLHNDRNLSHGNCELYIDKIQAKAIRNIINDVQVQLSNSAARNVVDNPNTNIISRDQIWNLSADVAEQKSLPEALRIMSDIYRIVFPPKTKLEQEESEENDE